MFSSDTRRGLCYTQVRNGKCSNPSFTAVTKSTCCCMEDNSNNGWGYPCEVCPKPGNPQYETVCPHGPGKNGNGGGRQVYDNVLVSSLKSKWLSCISKKQSPIIGSAKIEQRHLNQNICFHCRDIWSKNFN